MTSFSTPRRTVLSGAAWSTPVVLIGAAAPALAASPTVGLTYRFATYTNVGTGGAVTTLFILGNKGNSPYPAGATFQFLVSQSDGGAINRTTTLNSTRTTGFTATRQTPPPQKYQSVWNLTLTEPVPLGTGTTFPLTNPTFALDLGSGSAVHLTVAQLTASPGTTPAQSIGLNTWYDSSTAGWYLPSSGNTYPTGVTRQTRTI